MYEGPIYEEPIDQDSVCQGPICLFLIFSYSCSPQNPTADFLLGLQMRSQNLPEFSTRIEKSDSAGSICLRSLCVSACQDQDSQDQDSQDQDSQDQDSQDQDSQNQVFLCFFFGVP